MGSGFSDSTVTLRLLCGNAIGMTAAILVILATGDPWTAVVVWGLVAALGYVGSGILIDAYDL